MVQRNIELARYITTLLIGVCQKLLDDSELRGGVVDKLSNDVHVIEFSNNDNEGGKIDNQILRVTIAKSNNGSDIDDIWINDSIPTKVYEDNEWCSGLSFSSVIVVKQSKLWLDDVPINTQLTAVTSPTLFDIKEFTNFIESQIKKLFQEITRMDTIEYSLDSIKDTEQKLAETSASLYRLNDTIKSPDLLQLAHHIVRKAIQEGATVDNYKQYIPKNILNDKKFVNALNHISIQWIKSMKSLISLLDFPSKTDLSNEINMWQRLRYILVDIIGQTEKSEFQITLKLLRDTNISNTGLDALVDTELQKTLNTVEGYIQFLTSFPSYISGQNFDELQVTLFNFFGNAQKFSQYGYPVNRTIELIVLFNNNLMQTINSRYQNSIALSLNEFNADYTHITMFLNSLKAQLDDFKLVLREYLRKSNNLNYKEIIEQLPENTTTIDQLKEVKNLKEYQVILIRCIHALKYDGYISDINEIDHCFSSNYNNQITSNSLRNLQVTFHKISFDVENRIILLFQDRDLKSDSRHILDAKHLFLCLKDLSRFSHIIRKKMQSYRDEYLNKLEKSILLIIDNYYVQLVHLTNYYPTGNLSSFRQIYSIFSVKKQIQLKLRECDILFDKSWMSTPKGHTIMSKIESIDIDKKIQQYLSDWVTAIKQKHNNLLDQTLFTIINNGYNKNELSIILPQFLLECYRDLRNITYLGIQTDMEFSHFLRGSNKWISNVEILKEDIKLFFVMIQDLDKTIFTKIIICAEIYDIWTIVKKQLHITWQRIQTHNNFIEVFDTRLQPLLIKYDLSLGQETIIGKSLKNLKTGKLSIDFINKELNQIERSLNFLKANKIEKTNLTTHLVLQNLENSFMDMIFHHMNDFNFSQITIRLSKYNDSIVFKPSLQEINSMRIMEVQSVLKSFTNIQENLSESISNHSFSQVILQNITCRYYIKESSNLIKEEMEAIKVRLKETTMKIMILEIDVQQYQQVLHENIDAFLELCEDVVNLKLFTESNSHITITKSIKLDYSSLISDLKAKLKECFRILGNSLQNHLMTLQTWLDEKYKEFNGGLEFNENAEYEPPHLLKFFQLYFCFIDSRTAINTNIAKFKELIQLKKIVEETNHEKGQQIQKYINVYDRLENSFYKTICYIQENCQNEIKSLKQYCTTCYNSKLKEIETLWIQKSTFLKSKNLEFILPLIRQFQVLRSETANFKKMSIQVTNHFKLSNDVESINSQPPMEKEIDKWIVCLEELVQVEDALKSFEMTRLKDLSKQLNTTAIDKEKTKIEMLSTTLHETQAYKSIKQKILFYMNHTDILLGISSEQINERHMKELFDEIGCPPNPHLNFSELKICDLPIEQLLLNRFKVDEIISKAKREAAIKDSLDEIEMYWSYFTLLMDDSTAHIPILKDIDELRNKISEDMDILETMIISPFSVPYTTTIESWNTNLSNLSNLLNQIEVSQSQWLEFNLLFTNSNICSSLPLEKAQFDQISESLLSLILYVKHAANIFDLIRSGNVSKSYTEITSKLNKIKKKFSEFVESQRQQYPRFFFVNDQELVTILGAINDIDVLSGHLRKLYFSISSFDIQNGKIHSVVSAEGEILKLSNEIELSIYKTVPELLRSLDLEIETTLKTSIRDCLMNSRSLDEIFESNVYQVLTLWLQVSLSEKLHSYKHSKSKDELLEMETFLSRTCSWLNYKNVLSSESGYKKLKIEGMLLEVLKYQSLFDQLSKCTSNIDVDIMLDDWWMFRLIEGNEIAIECSRQDSIYPYAFNYLGVPEHLVFTKGLANVYNFLDESFHQNYGVSIIGPAGTGKTESIKSFGYMFGIFVTVFNFDDLIDFSSLQRIIAGILKLGLWASFDEFNRLEYTVMSAISEMISSIQHSLSNKNTTIDFLGMKLPIHSHTKLFLTMNPKYRGRRNLPENLRRLFRVYYFGKSDSHHIVEIYLSMYGNKDKYLAPKLINFLNDLKMSCSQQDHYDFGLRLIKAIFRQISAVPRATLDQNTIVSLMKVMILPRLTREDSKTFNKKLDEIFNYSNDREDTSLSSNFMKIFKSMDLLIQGEQLQKCLQLRELYGSNTGIILLGESGCGKTTILNALHKSFEQDLHHKIEVYYLDPKAIPKDHFFGYYDKSTTEWQDGIFSSIIRASNSSTECVPLWIVVDSDLDSSTMEAMNSMLDDNKLLTLGSGERLKVGKNIKLICETDSVSKLTPATVSRCSVVHLPYLPANIDEYINHKIHLLTRYLNSNGYQSIQQDILFEVSRLCESDIYKIVALSKDTTEAEINMNTQQLIDNFFYILIDFIGIYYSMSVKCADHANMTLVLRFQLRKYLIFAFSGHLQQSAQLMFLHEYQRSCQEKFWGENETLADKAVDTILYTITDTYQLELKSTAIKNLSTDMDHLIQTSEISLYKEMINSYLFCNRSLLLIGPPGSGKTMLIRNIIENNENYSSYFMSLSADSQISDIIRIIKSKTKAISKASEVVLVPKQSKKFVLFLDEINLPRLDEYGSHKVSLFIRQLIDKQGFWDFQTHQWLQIMNILIIGACNPLSYLGRVPLSNKFYKQVSVLFVDYPSANSLVYIYSEKFRRIFSLIPHLEKLNVDILKATIEIFYKFKEAFDERRETIYICTPRELTKLCKGLLTTVLNINESINEDVLFRVWLFEIWHIFGERLMNADDQNILRDIIYKVSTQFEIKYTEPNDLLFTSLISGEYQDVTKTNLMKFLKNRIPTYIEEYKIPDFVIMDMMAGPIISIERILSKPNSHAILSGAPRLGKKTLTKLTSWLMGLTTLEILIGDKDSFDQFFATLKNCIRDCISNDISYCLYVGCSADVETAYLEKINALIANADLPEIYEESELNIFLGEVKENAKHNNIILENELEVQLFIKEKISKGLHIVFSVSDDNFDNNSNGLLCSPTLVNRCTVVWFPSWSSEVYYEIATKNLNRLPLSFPVSESLGKSSNDTLKQLAQCIVEIDTYLRVNYLELKSTPSYFLDLLRVFENKYLAMLHQNDSSKSYCSRGLEKINDAVLELKTLTSELENSRQQLSIKEDSARKTLDELLVDQNEVERKHEATIEIKKILEKQEAEVADRKLKLMNQINKIEPVVSAAREGVKNIKKEYLTEIRSMAKPPNAVVLIMSAVCSLLGISFNNWKDIQQYMRKESFVKDIITFEPKGDNFKDRRSIVQTSYFADKNFNFAAINRASRACGPLYHWIVAQIEYSEVLDECVPLENEIGDINLKSNHYKANILAAESMIIDLHTKMKLAKENYANLIGEVENIKRQIKANTNSLNRAIKLVKTLSAERKRWTVNERDYSSNKSCLIGDSLYLTCASIYFGQLSELNKEKVQNLIFQSFKKYNISHSTLALIEEVSVEDKAQYLSCGLAEDPYVIGMFDLLIKSPQFTSIIIDPQNEIVEILKSYHNQNITIMSVNDPSFTKRYLKAIDFGGPVLITECEYLGTTTLSTLFDARASRRKNHIYLHTTSSTHKFPAYLLARVDIIDFSIKIGSIALRSLKATLDIIKPEYQKETEALRINKEQLKITLMHLEDRLLKELSDSSGPMLENDELLRTLEQLKNDSEEINEKIIETENNTAILQQIIENIKIIGNHAVQVYRILEAITILDKHYKISISRYLQYFALALKENDLSTFNVIEKDTSRLNELKKHLIKMFYCNIYGIISPSLKSEHRVVLAIALYICYNKTNKEPNNNDWLIKAITHLSAQSAIVTDKADNVDNIITENIDSLMQLKGMLDTFFKSKFSLENMINNKNFPNVVVINSHYQDGSSYITRCYSRLIDNAISLGTKESLAWAEGKIQEGISKGGCVLLQNIELGEKWINSYVSSITKRPSEKLKLFMIYNPTIKSTIIPTISNCDKIRFEGNDNICMMVNELFTMVKEYASSQRYVYLSYVLAWLHAIIVFKMRFAPNGGFRQLVAFSDNDFIFLFNIGQRILNRSNNDQLFWQFIKHAAHNHVYSIQLEDEKDKISMKRLIDEILPEEFYPKYMIVNEISISLQDSASCLEEQLASIKLPQEWETVWLGFNKDSLRTHKYDIESKVLDDTKQLLNSIEYV